MQVRSVTAFFIFFFLAQLSAEIIPITLEIAHANEQRAWGLMKRPSMPENHGMLFYQPKGHIWMFNTMMDLSIAFLDRKGKIIQITELKAYPEKMDPRRPVNDLQDMRKYPHTDPIFQFFLERSCVIPSFTEYALEMNKEWFDRHQVHLGDSVKWQPRTGQAYIETE